MLILSIVEHLPSKCTLAHRVCFQCREPGHESKACPKRFQDRTCGGCGQKGHISNVCTSRESWICKNCEEWGHGHWECTKPQGYRRLRCQWCLRLGHSTFECVNEPILVRRIGCV
ncbi:hypothetical protein BD311DRAFT_656287 [Dichomitus squalens]|uniref:CCHC-type domain-containing protein n=1 Tax=Dichomitus squalens TaxID=114155 RepID=A0A4Q9MZ66_9APHY|nr:hypothetical protein BD311DRAFT_656287 [Dichomitus squalens]